MGPNRIRPVSLYQEEIWTERQMGKEGRKLPCDWSDASTRERKPRSAGKHQELEGVREAAPNPSELGLAVSLISDFQPPPLWGNICLLLEATQSCVLYYSSLGKLIQRVSGLKERHVRGPWGQESIRTWAEQPRGHHAWRGTSQGTRSRRWGGRGQRESPGHPQVCALLCKTTKKASAGFE